VEVRLLGTGGWLPTDGRETACIALRDGADLLLLDAGTGLRRLATEPSLLEGVERLHVALTHFHLDHTYGLMAMPALRRLSAREVWAPGRLVAGRAGEELVHRLLDPPFLAPDPAAVTGEFATAVHELEAAAEIGPFRVETRVQPLHNGPTLALRVNGELVYCTDTAYDEENAAFAQGVRLLLHEAFWATDVTEDHQHSAAGEAARIAATADVERLVLVHVHPLLGDDDELAAPARAHFPAAEVGRDGAVL
jgi:ribonuclease BN (tRNA processing enzyme)